MTDTSSLADAGGALYPLLFEIQPDAMIVVDQEGVIKLANRKACEIFGLTGLDLVGSRVERLVPARFAENHVALRQGYWANSRTRPMEIDLELLGVRSDGTEFPVEIALSPFNVGAESFVAASIRDLSNTIRFKAAAKRARYSSQIVSLGERALRCKGIDQLLADVPAFITETLWTDVVIVYWTLHGTELRPRIVHGIPDELREQLDLTYEIGPDGKDAVACAGPHIVSNQHDATGVDAELARRLNLNSSVRVPLTSKAGLVGLLATYSRQISRFGEEELNFMQAVGNVIIEVFLRGEAEEHLAHAQRLESIGQLTGGIAHDFNNILTIVLGNLQMLRETLAESGNSYLKLVDSAQRAARRGADLTRKLLTFSRKQSLAPAAIELAATLGALSDMLERTIGKDIQVEWHVAPDCPPCLADPLQLDNAIVNLALNARDAMPGGGRMCMSAAPFTVDSGMADLSHELVAGDYVVIAVSDSGQGMPPDVLRRACEPFFTTKQSGSGSGLGLSMVWGFVKQSGGAFRIESEPGRGTTVKLYFPAADRRSPTGALRRAMHDRGAIASARRETILVVDDEPEVLDLAEVFLTRSGYHVLRATNSSDAMRWLTGPEPISLLFTDVVLGAGETGPTLAADALMARPGLPVLFTSGFAQGLQAGAGMSPAHFLPKPYEGEELVARIEALLAEPRSGNVR